MVNSPFATESTLILVSPQQGNKLRRVVGTRNSDIIQKTSRPRRWWACASKNIMSELGFRARLY